MKVSFNNSFSACVNILTIPLSSHVLRGVCKITGYELLESGVTLPEYLSYSCSGLPKEIRSIKDSELEIIEKPESYIEHFFHYLGTGIKRRALAFGESLGRYECWSFIDGSPTSKSKKVAHTIAKYAQYICYIVASYFTPRIRAVYPKKEIKEHFTELNFKKAEYEIPEHEKEYMLGAMIQPKETIPSDRLQYAGLLSQIDKKHMYDHITKNPTRVALGVTQVGFGVFLTMNGLALFF